MTRRPWHELERAFLVEHYPDMRTGDIAFVLRRTVGQVHNQAHKLGLHKSAAFLASEASGRISQRTHRGRLHQFPKGMTPWNKGRKMPAHVLERTAATQFKPGQRPQTWVPVGSTRITKDRCLQVKIADTRCTRRDFVPLALLIWEAAHGPAPAGHVVVFRPGVAVDRTDPLAIRAEHLECITRAELMARNTIHRLPKPLADVVRLRGALNRRINHLAKEAA